MMLFFLCYLCEFVKRDVTFILQNIKSTERNFEEWYSKKVDIMKDDDLLNHFKNMRNEILKEGQVQFLPVLKINGTLDLNEFPKKFEQPPNAKYFFIGDELGGKSAGKLQMN